MEEVLLIDAMLRRADSRQKDNVEPGAGNPPDMFALDSNFIATNKDTIAHVEPQQKNFNQADDSEMQVAYIDDEKLMKQEERHRQTTQAGFPSHRASRDIAEIQSSKKPLYSG